MLKSEIDDLGERIEAAKLKQKNKLVIPGPDPAIYKQTKNNIRLLFWLLTLWHAFPFLVMLGGNTSGFLGGWAIISGVTMAPILWFAAAWVLVMGVWESDID